MSTFGLVPGSNLNDWMGALNYCLSNVNIANNALTVNTNTGVVSVPGNGLVYSYLYRYLLVAYATSADGTQNFTVGSPTNATFYGLLNKDNNTPDTNPADYIWYSVAGGFGTTNFFWYQTPVAGQIQIYIGASAPGSSYVQDTGSPIDLTTVFGSTASISGSATNAENITVNNVIPAQTYYITLAEQKDGNYSAVDADSNFTYDSTPQLLSVPNVNIANLLTLKPQTTNPIATSTATGTIAVADNSGWDPAGIAGTTPYVAFYNGVSWVKLG
jgi:hypothetical protein